MANNRYAHVAPDGLVFEIFQETDSLKLTDIYNPVTAALFQVCPPNVQIGWWLISGAWYPADDKPTEDEPVAEPKGK